MIVPTAIEANELYQTTKEITKVDQMIEYNSQRRLELEAEKELLEQKNKELRQQKQELQRSLIGDRVF
jgi:predicted AAA+ superfamily ATPase